MVGLLCVHRYVHAYLRKYTYIFAGNESLQKSVSYARTLHDNKHNLLLYFAGYPNWEVNQLRPKLALLKTCNYTIKM